MDDILYTDIKSSAKRILKGSDPQKVIFDLMKSMIFSDRKYRLYYHGFNRFDFKIGSSNYNRAPRSVVMSVMSGFNLSKKDINALLDRVKDQGLSRGRIHRLGSKWKIEREW